MADSDLDGQGLEAIYVRWLRAAKNAAGGGAAVVREMQAYLAAEDLLEGLAERWRQRYEQPTATGRTTGWQSNYFALWEKGRVPREEALRVALVHAVTRFVPATEAVEIGVGFEEAIRELTRERANAQDRGADSARALAAQRRADNVRGLLLVRPSTASDVDLQDLGLGSWVYDGGVPPYVQRTADGGLVAAMRAAATGRPLTVVGPPKSGKTRSVAEALAREFPTSEVWWVNPTPGTLNILTDRISQQHHPEIVVLDDAHLHGLHGELGLTVGILEQLCRRSTVILIIHEDDWTRWEQQAIDRRGTGDDHLQDGRATPEFVALLTQNLLHLSSVLNDAEYSTALTSIGAAGAQQLTGIDMTRLAESYAAVRELQAKAQRGIASGGMRAAVVEASIDATVFAPEGVHLATLQAWSKKRYRQIEPNGLWSDTAFIEALTWALEGMAPRSPHAVITRRPDERFGLLDALVPRMREATRVIEASAEIEVTVAQAHVLGTWNSHIVFARIGYPNTTSWQLDCILQNIYHDIFSQHERHSPLPESMLELSAAESWLMRVAPILSRTALTDLALIGKRMRIPELHSDWLFRAAEYNDIHARWEVMGYWFFEWRSSDYLTKDAETYMIRNLERLVLKGDRTSMDAMCLIATIRGDRSLAHEMGMQARSLGSSAGARYLADEVHDDPNLARALYVEACDKGSDIAQYRLSLLDAAFTPEVLVPKYLAMAREGSKEALYRLHRLYLDMGDVVAARGIFDQARVNYRINLEWTRNRADSPDLMSGQYWLELAITTPVSIHEMLQEVQRLSSRSRADGESDTPDR